MTIDPYDPKLLRFVNRFLCASGHREVIKQIANVLQMPASQITFQGLYTPRTLGLRVICYTLKHLEDIEQFDRIFSMCLKQQLLRGQY
jgi:hypothetical protein